MTSDKPLLLLSEPSFELVLTIDTILLLVSKKDFHSAELQSHKPHSSESPRRIGNASYRGVERRTIGMTKQLLKYPVIHLGWLHLEQHPPVIRLCLGLLLASRIS